MVKNRKRLVYISSVIAVLVILFIFVLGRKSFFKILSPFIMGVVLSYLMYPIVKKINERGVSKGISILLTYIIFALILAAILYIFLPMMIENIVELTEKIPDIVKYYTDFFDNVISFIKDGKWPNELSDIVIEQTKNVSVKIEEYSIGILNGTFDFFAKIIGISMDFLVAVFAAFYFMKDTEYFKNIFFNIVPESKREFTKSCGREINSVLSSFLQGQLLAALIVGTLETVGMLIAGVDYAFFLGFIGGISNLIPFFGPFIGVIPAVLVSFLQSPIKALWVIIIFSVVQQVESNIITPKIMENKIGMHPVTTMFWVLVGGTFFGIIGLLFAIPVYSIVKVVFKQTVDEIT